ncbi:MAG: hypothetical protein RJA36_1513 [Pseudomonadota bacterium]|jgi:hypothetical protein
MPFIKFTKSRTTVEEHPQVFEAGRVYELSEESCERWKRRGFAEDATAPEPVAQVAAEVDKPAPKRGKKAEG